MREPDYTVRTTPPRMSQWSDVASNRQFDVLLSCAAQCAANCEPGHGVGQFERLPSSSIGLAHSGVSDASGALRRRDGLGDLTRSHRIGPELRYIHTRRKLRGVTETQMHAHPGWQNLMQSTHRTPSWRAAALLALLAATALGACSSGGNVDLGKSQTGDPATVDFPIFYVKRQVPVTAAGTLTQDDLRIMNDAVPTADLYMRASASVEREGDQHHRAAHRGCPVGREGRRHLRRTARRSCSPCAGRWRCSRM